MASAEDAEEQRRVCVSGSGCRVDAVNSADNKSCQGAQKVITAWPRALSALVASFPVRVATAECGRAFLKDDFN